MKAPLGMNVTPFAKADIHTEDQDSGYSKETDEKCNIIANRWFYESTSEYW